MNSTHTKKPSGEPAREIDPELEKAKSALAAANEALNRLLVLAYQNHYGASVLFEFTCNSCCKLGDVLIGSPALKEVWREWRSYYPVIIAEDPSRLDSGLRELAIKGEKANKLSLKRTHRDYPRNDHVRSEEAVFRSLLRHFVDGIISDPRDNSPWRELTSQRVSARVKERLLSHEFRYKKAEWAKLFVECLEPRLLDKKLGESDGEIFWEEWGDRFPDGILYRYGRTLRNDSEKPSIGCKTNEPSYALIIKAEGLMEALIGKPPGRKKKKTP